MMKKPTKCPHCGRYFPINEEICKCLAYRVDDNNYNLSFKKRFKKKKNG